MIPGVGRYIAACAIGAAVGGAVGALFGLTLMMIVDEVLAEVRRG